MPKKQKDNEKNNSNENNLLNKDNDINLNNENNKSTNISSKQPIRFSSIPLPASPTIQSQYLYIYLHKIDLLIMYQHL